MGGPVSDPYSIDDTYRIVATSLDLNTGEYRLTLNHIVLPPEPAPIIHYDEDSMYRQDYSISTDSNGNGYGIVDIPTDRVISILVNGPYPPNDGYLGAGPSVRRAQRGGQTVITLHAGPPNAPGIGISVWVAEPS